ncbi:unnamed protein product [Phytomonas sp. EM1]|nr:unnamed protein product [Phytomonas sp. EM1]|eukprot:CCW60116.1 unnamed protein product [Phytomonas sp. isolate EM1]
MTNRSESDDQKISIASLNHDAKHCEEEIERDPNVRLELYRAVCNAALSEASIRGPSAISPFWIDIILNGVEDMWSSTRRECVECIRKLFYTPALDSATVRLPYHSAHQSSLSSLADHNANVNQSKRGAFPIKPIGSEKRGHIVNGGGTTASCADWRRQLASKLLYRWTRTRNGSAGWYQREGLLRVLKIYCEFNHTFYQNNFEGQLWLHEVLFRAGIPALHEAQLPVREEAASLLCIIAEQEGAVCSYVFDRVVSKLQGLLTTQKTPSPPSKTEEAQTHVVEGHLIALIKLFERDPRSDHKESTYPLLMRYASHPASSVRQYVAEALCPPSEMLCIRLLKQLSIGSRWSSSHVQNNWQEGETILMALQRHLLYYLAQGKGYDFNLERLISAETDKSPACFFHSCLESLLDASCASRFELSRMGQQIIPLLLQLWVRFASTVEVVLTVVRELVPSSAPSEYSSMLQRDRCHILVELIIPLLWWYLVVRQATATMEDQENRRVEGVHVSHFLSTLQDRTWKVRNPMFSIVMLIIGCYFLPLLEESDVAIVHEILLDSQTWENILRTPPAMPYLHFGIDFVSSMKYKGRDLQHLVPVWLTALEGAQTHHQCILATMIREALCFSDAESQEESGKVNGSVFCRPFRFAYHDTFAAPAMLDGGEEMSLGYTWLKTYFPTVQEIPSGEMFFGTAMGSYAVAEDFERQKAVVNALRRYVCNDLYLSPLIEPEILREARTLMAGMVRAYPGQECLEFVLDSLLMRLDRVCPQWESKEENTIRQKQKGRDWDIWDDDNAGCGPVEGISIEEIRDASHIAAHIMQKMSPEAQQLIYKKFGDRLVKLMY